MEKMLLIPCNCRQVGHIVQVSYDEDFAYIESTLNVFLPWYKRVWQALLYVLNRGQCNYDCTVVDKDEAVKIINFLQDYREQNEGNHSGDT